jgi:hypothetical protein
MRIPILVSCLLAAACGGSTLEPGAGDSQGGGTHTLSVDGAISAEPRIVNASSASDFDTHFDVRIDKDQVAVTTGTVTINSNGGPVQLTYHDGNHWVGDQPGYFEVYELSVVSGNDQVTGVRVDGPDIHVFTAPGLGATVDAAAPLAVAWSRDDHAEQCGIQTERLDWIAMDDSGSYSLPVGSLKVEKDKAVNEEVQVRRINRVSPAGAVAGSEVSVSVRNRVDVVVAANPNAP